MNNVNKLAKSLAKNANQRGYVTIDQEAFAKIKAALNLASTLAEESEQIELTAIADAGIAAANALTKPMPLGHAYDILSGINGFKDFNGLSAALSQDKPAPVEGKPMILDGSVDYIMGAESKDSRIWVEVGAISVYIKRTHEGVIVDLFATGCEDNASLGSVAMEWVDAEEAMRQAGCGWLVYSPSEAAAANGAGFWSNFMGWCYEDEATVFTDTEKSQFNLPISSGNDSCWVSLAERPEEAGHSGPGRTQEIEKIECVQCGLPTQVDDYGTCNHCHHLNELPIQVLDDEQPTTCPKCGSRTEFDELTEGRQHHTCLGCGYEFVGEFDEDSATPD